MAISINAVPLLSGNKQYINGQEIKDIIFNGVNIWHYDSTAPSMSIISPANASYVYSTSNIAVSGTASDADSGIASVKVGNTNATLSNVVKDANGKITSCRFFATITSNSFYVTVQDGAGNSTSKHVVLSAEKYNSISRWSSTPGAGDVAYYEYCRCDICGRGGEAHKYRSTGNLVEGSTDTLFSDCPNGPHYRYRVYTT